MTWRHFGYRALVMRTIKQHCPAPDCNGNVRYRAGASSSFIEGACAACGRRYRLVAGRPAEIDRQRPRSARLA